MPDYHTLAIAFEETLKRKDPYDHHGRNVSRIVCKMAQISGRFSSKELKLLKWAAFLHDIGKVYISDQVLNKPSRLTTIEMSQVRTHVHLGWDLAKAIGCHSFILDAIYCHHENENGTGYPRNLKSPDIPVSAKFIRVADTYDALINERIYRKAWPEKEIFMLLDAEAGDIFDTEAVSFLKLAMIALEKDNANEHR